MAVIPSTTLLHANGTTALPGGNPSDVEAELDRVTSSWVILMYSPSVTSTNRINKLDIASLWEDIERQLNSSVRWGGSFDTTPCMASSPVGTRAVIYLRISLDETGEGLAVRRQLTECLRLAEQRGWHVTAVYIDNSMSATDRRKKRPGYDAMTDAYNAGLFGAIICYDLDRLTRQPRQLEDWIEAASERGLVLVTANGEADLGTDAGRMFARIKAAVARGEVDRKSKRQKDANAQRRERGVIPWGVRLTGYYLRCPEKCPKDHEHQRERQTGEIIPAEAKIVREIFKRFNAGDSLCGIARWLNESGFPARHGGIWRPSSLRSLLANPRYAGLQVLDGKETGHKGAWEAIITESVFRTAQETLTDPRRITNREGTERKHLGAGLYRCDVCGDRLRSHGTPTRYRCCDGGHVTRTGARIDEFVLAYMTAWLKSDKVGNLDLTPKADEAPAEPCGLMREGEVCGQRHTAAEHWRDALARVERDYDNDEIDAQRYKVKRAKIEAALKAADVSLRKTRAGVAFASVMSADDPAAAFLAAPLGIQRAIIDEYFHVRLLSAPRGRKGFDPASVRIAPKTAGANTPGAALHTRTGVRSVCVPGRLVIRVKHGVKHAMCGSTCENTSYPHAQHGLVGQVKLDALRSFRQQVGKGRYGARSPHRGCCWQQIEHRHRRSLAFGDRSAPLRFEVITRPPMNYAASCAPSYSPSTLPAKSRSCRL